MAMARSQDLRDLAASNLLDVSEQVPWVWQKKKTKFRSLSGIDSEQLQEN
jgi:hypothetical protein